MEQLELLLDWYRTLTPDSVARVAEFYDSRACFKDPFNDVQGVAAIQRIFEHMFVATESPRFVILDTIAGHNQAFVSWRFEFVLRKTAYQIAGATHLRFNDAGMVVDHRDYWDAAEELLQKLPLVGAPIRWLRARFRTPA